MTPCPFFKTPFGQFNSNAPLASIHTLTKLRECRSRSRELRSLAITGFVRGDGGKDGGSVARTGSDTAVLNRFCGGSAEVLRSEEMKKGRRRLSLRGRRRVAVDGGVDSGGRRRWFLNGVQQGAKAMTLD